MKFISFLLSFFMVAPLFTPIKAAENEEGNIDITDYVVRARDLFGVSMDYDEVDSNVSENSVRINWSVKNDYDRNESVTFDYNKNVLSYHKNFEYKRFNRTLISKDEAKDAISKLVKKMYPNNDVRFESVKISNSNYVLKFRLYLNGVRVFKGTSTINLNKENGVVNNVSTTPEFQAFLRKNPTIDTKGIKGEGEAFSAITEKFVPRLDLIKRGEDKYVPFYTWQNALMVDAKTLEPVDYNYFVARGYAEDKAEAKAGNPYLTEREIEEKDKIRNLKTKEEAEKKAIELFSLPKDKHRSTSLNPIYNTGFYNYQVVFDDPNRTDGYYYASASIKAEDLIPLRYSKSDSNDESKKVDKSVVEPTIEKIAKELPFFSEYKEEKPMFENKEDEKFYSREYLRRIGEYTVPDDRIAFSFNGGGLSYYSLDRVWEEIDHYEKKIDKKQAFMNLKDKFGSNLYVMGIFDKERPEDLKETRLVYAVDANDYELKVRATDGKVGFDESNILNPPTGEAKNDLVKDAIVSGFGVIGKKGLNDSITYRDLLYNLAYIDGDTSENDDTYVKAFKDLKIFTKDNLEDSVTFETLAKALVLKKLGLKPENIKTDVFNSEIKANEKAYPALLIMLTGNFKDKDFIREATVSEMLEAIAGIVF